MTDDQKLGIILGITTVVCLLIFGSVFLYYSMLILKNTVKNLNSIEE